MSCEVYRELLSAYLDDSLDEVQANRFSRPSQVLR